MTKSYRYAHNVERSSSRCAIEVHLQKVYILTIPRSKEKDSFEVMQFSKYDTVEDLFKRVEKAIGTDEFRLWKMKMPDLSFEEFVGLIKLQYESDRQVMIDGELIDNS